MSYCLASYQQPNFASLIDNLNQELFQRDGGSEEENKCGVSSQIKESRLLITEIRAQNFDVIRFATYRTACKLRFIQKRTNLYLVDIWNVIEAFRENNLNSQDSVSEVYTTNLESVIQSIYSALNKRLPNSAQIDIGESVNLLNNWLLNIYDPNGHGVMRVLSIKASLSTLCAGKLVDKLRYIFTLVSDSNGFLVRSLFDNYLQEVLSLPSAVFEGPSFRYSENVSKMYFDKMNQVTSNDFIDTFMAEPGPQCLMWLPILHRLAAVENVFHPPQCEACHRESFTGFRYKCQRCYNYNLCQDCFWRGRTSGNHSNDHDVKEYSFYKSAAKQIGHSLKKSFRCLPNKSINVCNSPNSEILDKNLDLSHIVMSVPSQSLNSSLNENFDSQGHPVPLDRSNNSLSKRTVNINVENERSDDEHRLIARYTARLAADSHNAMRSPCELGYGQDSNHAHRQLIAQLEAKNRSIMREIQHLRYEQQKQTQTLLDSSQPCNPVLLAELQLLRQRRDDLETRMTALQDSRKELMVQLEGLMKLLRNSDSPRSSMKSINPGCLSGFIPSDVNLKTSSGGLDSLNSMGGTVLQAFSQQSSSNAQLNSVCSMRNHLLVAADSVTDAMSFLVKELNSEASSSGEDDDFVKHRDDEVNIDEFVLWQREMQNRLQQERVFLQSLQNHHRHFNSNGTAFPGNGVGRESENDILRTDEEEGNELYDRDPQELKPYKYMAEDESYLETDQESYVRTDDDEEGGGTDWEDSAKRWVNR